MNRILCLLAALVFAACFVVGCTPKTEGDAASEGTMTTPPTTEDDDDATEDADEPGDVDEADDPEGASGDDQTSSTDGADMELADYKNQEGKLACPVMDVEIESEDKAFAHLDIEGVRYYFCCNGCPEAFKKDPAKYLD